VRTKPGEERGAKADGYAAAGIPVHLLVDRDGHELVVHSHPERGRYRDVHRTAGLGEELLLPEPVGVRLDTEALKAYLG